MDIIIEQVLRPRHHQRQLQRRARRLLADAVDHRRRPFADLGTDPGPSTAAARQAAGACPQALQRLHRRLRGIPLRRQYQTGGFGAQRSTG